MHASPPQVSQLAASRPSNPGPNAGDLNRGQPFGRHQAAAGRGTRDLVVEQRLVGHLGDHTDPAVAGVRGCADQLGLEIRGAEIEAAARVGAGVTTRQRAARGEDGVAQGLELRVTLELAIAITITRAVTCLPVEASWPEVVASWVPPTDSPKLDSGSPCAQAIANESANATVSRPAKGRCAARTGWLGCGAAMQELCVRSRLGSPPIARTPRELLSARVGRRGVITCAPNSASGPARQLSAAPRQIHSEIAAISAGLSDPPVFGILVPKHRLMPWSLSSR